MKLPCCVRCGVCLSLCLIPLLLLVTANESGGAGGQSTLAPAASQISPTHAAHPGYKHAQVHCATCHLVPEPGHITRSVWEEIVLPNMAFYTGINQLDPDKNPEADLFLASGLFPPKPALPREAWDQITSYYLDHAPIDRIPHEPRPEITVGLPHFQVETPRFRRDPPLTTMVQIDEARRVIYAADAATQSLHILSPEGRELDSIFLGNIPVWMKNTERGIYLACIGHFFPLEERRGQIILLERTATGFEHKVLFSHLPRPCHIEVADLHKNGREDLIVSMFGFLTGRLSWYENLGNDEYRERILFDKAGALITVVHDFNNNGYPDIAVLTGQETEQLLIYYNDAKGGFEPAHQVFQQPPSYGHTYMEAVDLNNNGRLDLLVCAGDNGDYESPAKPYHGIRIYLNQDGRNFKKAAFLPMHGVFRAIARDFDGDGNIDIASIGFYPDYETTPRESFVYWKNEGNLTFTPYTFRECISGRWMVMDVGDLSGNGHLDIVLGSLIRMPGTRVPDFVRNIWETVGPSVLILNNTLP
jgi:hypothetical protein